MKADVVVVVEGRKYTFEVQPANCESLKHRHDGRHADGSPGMSYHHHHSTRCRDLPLNATLRPVKKFADAEQDLREYEQNHPDGTRLTADFEIKPAQHRVLSRCLLHERCPHCNRSGRVTASRKVRAELVQAQCEQCAALVGVLAEFFKDSGGRWQCLVKSLKVIEP